MTFREKKGVFLIFSLWIFTLLSLFCLGLGFRTFIEIRKTKLILNKTRAFSLAVSGIKLATVVLEQDNSSQDYLDEDWTQLMREDVIFSSPQGEGVLVVRIEDEASRININSILDESDQVDETVKQCVEKLFEKRGVEDLEEKIAYILDYIDKDNESRYADSEDKVKNGNLSVVEELLVIKNITKEDYGRVRDFLTVYVNDNKININTVKKELLEAILDSLVNQGSIPSELKSQVLEVRFGSGLVEGDEDDGYFDTELPAELVQTGLFRINSDTFRIISEADVGGSKKKITCVINRESGKIVYWYEK